MYCQYKIAAAFKNQKSTIPSAMTCNYIGLKLSEIFSLCTNFYLPACLGYMFSACHLQKYCRCGKTDIPLPSKDRLSPLSVICRIIPQNPLVPLSTCSDINSLIKPKMNKRKQTNDKVSTVSSNEPQNKQKGSENEA